MNDELKKRGQALEEDYFHHRDQQALERLAAKKNDKPRLSPITGKPLLQKVLNGVVIDQCQDSGGVWLDAGELEQILSSFKDEEASIVHKFFSAVLGKK
jgi:hypothetical protein